MLIDPQERKTLEQLAGRELTDREILNGGVHHEELRDKRALFEKNAKFHRRTEPDPDDAAIAHLEERGQQKLSTQEALLEKVKQRRVDRISSREAAEELQRIMDRPDVKAAIAEAEQFVRRVRFTTAASVEQVERAQALLELAQSGDVEAFTSARNELSNEIHQAVLATSAEAEKQISSVRQVASMFAVEVPEPEPPKSSTDFNPYDYLGTQPKLKPEPEKSPTDDEEPDDPLYDEIMEGFDNALAILRGEGGDNAKA